MIGVWTSIALLAFALFVLLLAISHYLIESRRDQ